MIVQVHTSMDTSKDTHWMVLREIGSTYVKLNDPGVGSYSTGNNRQFTLQQFLNSWQSSACDRIAIVVDNNNPLNQSLPIYGGSVTVPKEMSLVFEDPQFNFATSQISEIKISGGGVTKAIPTSAIVGQEQFSVPNPDGSTKLWRRIKVQPTASQLSNLPNGRNYTISFKLNNGGIKTYQNGNLYFENFNTFASLADTRDLNNWAGVRIRIGASEGLYRGPSPEYFQPSENLTRAQAAVVCVNLAVRLKLINIIKTGAQFQDVSVSHPFFDYIQTLRNYNYISANATFSPDNFISIGEFCKMLCNVMNVQPSDYANTSYINYMGRKIIVNESDASLNLAMNKLLKLVNVSDTDGFWVSRNVWDFFDFSSINSTSNIYNVSGSAYVSRAKMAIVIQNIANWKSKKLGSPLYKTSSTAAEPDLTNMVALGEKYDNADITAESTPVVPSQQNYSCLSGGSITISYDPSALPQHYYWSMQKNGATLTSNNVQHSSVTFTAPTVLTPTQWKLYAYTANNKGKAIETFITINVGGSSGGTNAAPTLQAHSLLLYGATSTSITAAWTRGNGQNCIVTCREVGANSQDVPDSGVVYTGNTSFGTAPVIFAGSDTKVVYTGIGSSCIITGLNPNTQYQIAVFEYNGTTPLTVLYNLSIAPTTTGSTLYAQNQQVITNFNFSTQNVIPSQAISLNNTSVNANSYVWTCTPAANINSSTSISPTISFNSAGTYTIRLDATNTTTGQSTYTVNSIYVSNPNELLPDLVPQNAVLSATNMVANSSVNININVANLGRDFSNSSAVFVKYYLSKDQVLDSNDFQYSTSEYQIPNSVPGSDFVVIPTRNLQIGSQNIYLNNGAGQYYVLVTIDGTNLVPEVNENNNMVALPIMVQNAYPNPFVQNVVAPSTAQSGQTIAISTTLNNSGFTDCTVNDVKFYLSSDTAISADDYDMGWYTSNIQVYPNLAVAFNYNIILPATLVNGTYNIIVGGNLSNNDFNFANNSFSRQIVISNPNQPTLQTSNINISNITTNSMNITWTNGNGDNRVVVVKETTPLDFSGISENGSTRMVKDGVVYSANSDFTLASPITYLNTTNFPKVVYFGSGNSAQVTGITPNKNYFINVYECNGVGTAIDYLQESSLKYLSVKTKDISNNNGNWLMMLNTLNSNWSNLQTFNSNNVVGFTNNSGVGSSVDNGNTWSFYNDKIKQGNILTSFFVTENRGIVLDYLGTLANVKMTDNGGKSYQNTLSIPYLGTSFFDVHFPSNLIGFIAFGKQGNGGLIYKTTDGGLSWNTIYNTSETLNKVFFVNNQVGFAVSRTKLLKTSDGGVTWAVVPISVSCGQEVMNLQFINENAGWVSSYCGKIYRTNNGGSTWTSNDIATQGFNDFHFLNEQIGYLITQNSQFGKTFDGGLNWVFESIPSYQNTSSTITARNTQEIWLGGATILKSTTSGENNLISISQPLQNSYCQNQNVRLIVDISGIYTPNNVFKVELSDSTGSFASPTTLNTFGSAMSGSINVVIPQNIAVGTGYKLRIVGTSPIIVSNVTNAFAITTAPQATISIAPIPQTICPNQTVTFTATPTNGGTAPAYTWKKNGVVVGTNSATYNATGLNSGDVVWAEMVSTQACASAVPIISAPITANVTQIDSPFIQAIDNILAASTDAGVQWIRNGQPIVGATSQFFEATQTGFYQFRVTVGSCTVLSDVYQITSLGTETNEFSNQTLKVFPNPFNDMLTIEVNDDNLQSYQIIDLQGRVIVSDNLSGNSHQIKLHSLPQAVYILEIITDKGKQKVKIVKK